MQQANLVINLNTTIDGVLEPCVLPENAVVEITFPSDFVSDGGFGTNVVNVLISAMNGDGAFLASLQSPDRLDSGWITTNPPVITFKFKDIENQDITNCDSYPDLSGTLTNADITDLSGGAGFQYQLTGTLDFLVPTGDLDVTLNDPAPSSINLFKSEVSDEVTITATASDPDIQSNITSWSVQIGSDGSVYSHSETELSIPSGQTITHTFTIPGWTGNNCGRCGTQTITFTATDAQGNTGSDTKSITINESKYGCTDIQATNCFTYDCCTDDNYSQCYTEPPDGYVTHDNGTCVYDTPPCDIGFSEIFLEEQTGIGANPISIPQFIELVNFNQDDVDLNGYYLQFIKNGVKENVPLVFPTAWGSTIMGYTSLMGTWYCPSNDTYYSSPNVCDNECTPTQCSNNPGPGKLLLISNSTENNNGLIQTWGNNGYELDVTQGWGGAHFNYNLPTISASDSVIDYGECPANPWNGVGENQGFNIVLYNGNPDEPEYDPVCHLCLGSDFVMTHAADWFSNGVGKSWEYDISNGEGNSNIQNPINWNQSTTPILSQDNYLFDMDAEMLWMEENYLTLSTCDTDGDNDFNDLCYDLGQGAANVENFATPLSSPTITPPTIISDCGEHGCCTDTNALNYVCNSGQPYADDWTICALVPPPYVQCTDGTFGEDSTTPCCQYEVQYGCNDIPTSSTTPNNYFCDTLPSYNKPDYCTWDGSDWITRQDCVTELNGEPNQYCVQDDNFPTDDGTTWCEYPFVIWFGRERQDQNRLDLNIFNSIPIEGIAQITISGLDVTNLIGKASSWNTANRTVEYDGNGRPTTVFEISKGAGDPNIPAVDFNSYDCTDGVCTEGQKLLTMEYAPNQNSTNELTIEIVSTNTEISIDQSYGDGNGYADNVITSDTLQFDCLGHPYRPGSDYQETTIDNCDVCQTIIYTDETESDYDYSSMDGCWYNQTGTLCTPNISGCTDCNGEPNGSAVTDCVPQCCEGSTGQECHVIDHCNVCGLEANGTWIDSNGDGTMDYTPGNNDSYCTFFNYSCGQYTDACGNNIQCGTCDTCGSPDCIITDSGSSCGCNGNQDCNGVCINASDACNYIGIGSDNAFQSNNGIDDCGTCGGNGSQSGEYVTCCDGELVCTPADCTYNYDECGECDNYSNNGGNQPDFPYGNCDCSGESGGDDLIDFCGVCIDGGESNNDFNTTCCGDNGYASASDTCTCDAGFCSSGSCPAPDSGGDFSSCCDVPILDCGCNIGYITDATFSSENSSCCPIGSDGDGTNQFGDPDCAGVCGGTSFQDCFSVCVNSDTVHGTDGCGANGQCISPQGGECVCDDGYAGNICQYSDSGTCNNHGTAQDNGTCICDEGWAGDGCPAIVCCQYSDSGTCGGNGQAQDDGSCVCNSGYAGSNCEYNDIDNCGGNGDVQDNGSCICDSGYAGSTCQYSDAVTCNGNGQAQNNGSCICNTGYYGNSCEYDEDVNCNGNGDIDLTTGLCVCDNGFDGTDCEYSDISNCGDGTTAFGEVDENGNCECYDGYAGSTCQYSDVVNCNGNGDVQDDGSCICNSGYAGNTCQYSDAVDCSGEGEVNNSGNCDCNAGYYLSNCSGVCDCNSIDDGATCDDSQGFNNTGDGTCTCSEGYNGPNCEYSDENDCSDLGDVDFYGNCTCNAFPVCGTDCGTTCSEFSYNACVSDVCTCQVGYDCNSQCGGSAQEHTYPSDDCCLSGNVDSCGACDWPVANQVCTGCMNEEASNYNEPCFTTYGINCSISDENLCEYDDVTWSGTINGAASVTEGEPNVPYSITSEIVGGGVILSRQWTIVEDNTNVTLTNDTSSTVNVQIPLINSNGVDGYTESFTLKYETTIRDFDPNADNVVQSTTFSVTINDDAVYGCTDESSCNYDSSAEVNCTTPISQDDCTECYYIDYPTFNISECDMTNIVISDTCTIGGMCDCSYNTYDCAGSCPGSNIIDSCGVCVNPDNLFVTQTADFTCVDGSTGQNGLPSGTGDYLYITRSQCPTSEDFYNGDCSDLSGWSGSSMFCFANATASNLTYVTRCQDNDNDLEQWVVILANDVTGTNGIEACNALDGDVQIPVTSTFIDCNDVCDPTTPQGVIDQGNGLIYGSFIDNCETCSPFGQDPDYHKDCHGVCYGSNYVTDCGCIGPQAGNDGNEDWCDDCANVPFGVSSQDFCPTCMLPQTRAILEAEPYEYFACIDWGEYDGSTTYCVCDDINPCPFNHTCVVPNFDWWDSVDYGLCYKDWTSSCAPEFNFGSFDPINGELSILTTIPEGSQIGEMQFIVKIKSESTQGIIPTINISDGIMFDNTTLIGQNCPNTPTITNLGEDGDGFNYYRYNLCRDSGDTVITEVNNGLLFKIKFDNSGNNTGWFYPNGGNIYAEFDRDQSFIYRETNTSEYSLLYTEYSINWSSIPFKRVLGCIDPYATNCNAEVINNCDCVPGSPGYFDCANEMDTSCEYPLISFNEFAYDSSNTITESLDCDYYSVDCFDSNNPSDGTWDSYHTFNPLTEFSREERSKLKVNYNYDFSGLYRDVNNQHQYSINTNYNQPLNSVINPKVILPNGTIVQTNDAGNLLKTIISVDGSAGDLSGTTNLNQVFRNTILFNEYWGTSDTGDSPSGNCGDGYCPYDGLYTLVFEWPWNWSSLTDPLTGTTMTQPRVKSITKFELRKDGCMDVIDDVCNQNQYSSHDCIGEQSNDTSCCTYKSELYGSSTFATFGSIFLPTNTISSCCLQSQKDDANICEGDEINEISVHGINAIRYYLDEDNDNVGCDESGTRKDLWIYDCPWSDSECAGSGQGANNFYALNTETEVSGIWGNAVARLTGLETQDMCYCPTNVWDSEYCNECSESCSDQSIDATEFNNWMENNLNTPNESINNFYSSDCNNPSYGDGSGVCVDNVCRYLNPCGICRNKISGGSYIEAPLDVGVMYVTFLTYRDCNDVCYGASDFGSYYDLNCSDFCIGGSTGLSHGTPEEGGDTEDYCGRCLNINNTDELFNGQVACLNPPNSTDYGVCEPVSSDGTCYTWEGGCFNCANSNVGLDGDSGYDSCCNCGGDCVGEDGSVECINEFGVGNNLYEVNDCSGNCGNPNDLSFKTFDDWQNCCDNNAGVKVDLYPDLDNTSRYETTHCRNNIDIMCQTDADCGGGSGDCTLLSFCLGGDNDGEHCTDGIVNCTLGGGICLSPNCTSGPFNGCSGEIGFCQDFGPTNQNISNPICTRCSITTDQYCLEDDDCPTGETCSSQVNFYNVNTASYCIPDEPLFPLSLNSSQPDSSSPGSNVQQDFNFYPMFGEMYQLWDYCINYGPDSCLECWENLSDWNSSQDCAGICPDDVSFGSELDSCNVCYYPPDYECDSSQISDIEHPCFDQSVGDNYIPNACFVCRDPLANCGIGESHNDGSCNYQSSDTDCSGVNGGNDISCCYYKKPEINKISKCEGSTPENILECSSDEYCQSIGAGNCIDALMINRDIDSLFPIQFTMEWDATESLMSDTCDGEIFSIYRNIGDGNGFQSLDTMTSTETFIDNLNDVNEQDLTIDSEIKINYYVISSGICTYPHQSDNVEFIITEYNAGFNMEVKNNFGELQDSFSFSDYLAGTQIWIEANYSNIPILQGNSFNISFDAPWNTINDMSFTFPTWSNGATDGGYEDQTYWYCPTTVGTTYANGSSNGRWLLEHECNSGDNSGWIGCSLPCTNYFKVYFDITSDVFNFGCGDDFNSVIQYHLYWPLGSEDSYYDCIDGTDCDITVSSVEGCMDDPELIDGYYLNGACTCETCYDLCEACSSDWSGEPLDVPPACYQLGFYNPNANYDKCVERDDDYSILNQSNECCSGVNFETANTDCVNLGVGYNCSHSCIYPVYGCMDDGTLSSEYSNNQGGTGSVLPYSYKCPSVENACNNPGTEDYINYCDDYGFDQTCDGCLTQDCIYRPTPAANFDPDATYDLGTCQYGGCLDPDALNYSVPPTSLNYGCEREECNGWIDDSDNSCIIPFDYELHYRVIRQGVVESEGLIPIGEYENANCMENYASFYQCTGGTLCNAEEGSDACPGDETCNFIETGGVNDTIKTETQCNEIGGTWVTNDILVRKSMPAENLYLDLQLKGAEGWNCLGDDSGQIYDDESQCINECSIIVSNIQSSDPDTYMRTCEYICPDNITSCGDGSDPEGSCGGVVSICTPGYYPSLDLVCGTCDNVLTQQGVYYPSEEFPQVTIPFEDGLSVGNGWEVEDGNSYSGVGSGFPNGCINDFTSCNIITLSNTSYGFYNYLNDSTSINPVPKTYSVTITDPNTLNSGYETAITKKLNFKYVRNDYLPLLVCAQYEGQCIDDDITLDVGSADDYIFPIRVDNNQENDPYWFEIEIESDTNEPSNLNVKIDESDQLVFYDLDQTGTGTFIVKIQLHQPFPNPNWDSNPPSDLTLYYLGLPNDSTPGYDEIVYNVNIIDTSGPSGSAVYTLVPSFGISPDRFLFSAIGDDLRPTIDVASFPGDAGDWYGYTCMDGSICQNNDGSTCPTRCSNNGAPCNDSSDCSDGGECLGNGGNLCNPGADLTGETVTLNNPNMSGFIPSTGNQDVYNTVWKYEVYLYECLNSECDENNGTAQILPEYPVEFSDWSTDYYGLDSIPKYYYPPSDGLDNIWTSRWICPDSEFSSYGDYCGNSAKNLFNNFQSGHWCCMGEAVCPNGDPCNPLYNDGDLNPCGSECACPGYGDEQENGSDMCIQVSETSDFNGVSHFLSNGHSHQFTNPGWYKVKILSYDLFYSPNATLLQQGTLPGEDERIFNVEYVIPINQSVPDNYLPWQGINLPNSSLDNHFKSEELIEEYNLDGRKDLGCFLYSDTYTNNHDDNQISWTDIVRGTGMDNTPWNIDCSNPNNSCDSDGIDFYPDVDIRTPLSLKGESYEVSGKYSNLFHYYDRKLQPIEYNETKASTSVNFYFYSRDWMDGDMFISRNSQEQEWFMNTLYVGFIDWGDGSDIEYDSTPHQLGWNSQNLLSHNYEKPGIYEITGRMFRGMPDVEGNVLGVDKHHRFVCRININEDVEYKNEFDTFGGKDDYDYYPMWESTPIVGGVSEWSVYGKSIKRTLGWLEGIEEPIDIYFKNYGDKLRTEYALSQIDSNYFGKGISNYTGSYAHDSSNYFTTNTNIDIYSYLDDEIKTFTSELYSGFFSGSVDNDGILQASPTPTLISFGSYKEVGELGNHLGEVDLGQVRYFSTGNTSMAEILGFSNVEEVGNPSSQRYWKNIIPENYKLIDREGVTQNEETGEFTIDENSPQTWIMDNNGNLPYYPVLPKLNQWGVSDDLLGYQQDESTIFPMGTDSDNNYQSKDLMIDLDFQNLEKMSLLDKGGDGVKGKITSDFKVKFNEEKSPSKSDSISDAELGKDNKKSF